jgi:hypothetical protein
MNNNRDPNVYHIASAAYVVDKQCRLELSTNQITDEPDYVSNLTRGIRRYWDHHGLPCLAHSQTLPNNQETTFGCDAIIIIRRGDYAKICLFEAKYPRFGTGYQWDSTQSSSQISHFSDQLSRQHKWSHSAAIWEFFIHDSDYGDEPDGFQSWASSCKWHKPTYSYDWAVRHGRRDELWDNDDLDDLVNDYSSPSRDIRFMIRQACQCRVGTYLAIEEEHVTIKSRDEEDAEEIDIPATLEALDTELEDFCRENGITNLLYVRIDKSET